MVEMIVCTILLSVVAAILVPGIHAIHEQRKASRLDAYTLIELNNQAEFLASQSPTDELQLSGWFLSRYPTAELTVAAVPIADGNDSTDTLSAMRLTITRPATDERPDFVRSVVCWLPAKETAE